MEVLLNVADSRITGPTQEAIDQINRDFRHPCKSKKDKRSIAVKISCEPENDGVAVIVEAEPKLAKIRKIIKGELFDHGVTVEVQTELNLEMVV